MPVVALKEYVGVARDRVENFNGKQLIYASWDHHLLFAAPFLLCLPPQTSFAELLETALKPLLLADPDAALIDWHNITWLKGNQPWVPDFAASLAANGIRHKDQLRFQTPGLNTVCAVS
ncbi:phenol hydroxylase subunit P4 [Pseudomonas sp. N040]|uniref:phenol hydroxylase subunit P4 n=1 Tax=Pseudomonas sp. N040 TaxID=2785325 RepID=UPI0018A2C8E2|nr:phenol hydroxylase subunit P4 [Pseudomonas sp. N040]MBF7729129.1 phenol hydroxylase subunit P4 [Pseudomonas sp. N040]MBW7012769.1 phenol hydroxylase subunit P4 [Pseudomonas sp. N040]